MTLPVIPNTTCDLYRDPAFPPPNPPDLSGVRLVLIGDYGQYLERGEPGSSWKFTHVALVELDLDIRDRYHLGNALPTKYDTLWVPDQNGTAYRVVFVERVGRGTALDHKRVYLLRAAPPWPVDTFV